MLPTFHPLLAYILCCHCLPPFRDNAKNAYCTGERCPEKDTVPSVSQMLAVKSASAAVSTEVVGVAGTNACRNQFLYSELFKLQCLLCKHQCLSTYPAKLTDFDGISCSMYILPKKTYKLNMIHCEVHWEVNYIPCFTTLFCV